MQEEIQATCVVAFAKHPCNLKHCDEQMYCIDEEIQNIDKILAGFESIRRSEKRKDTPLIFVVGLLEVVGMLNLAKTNPKWLGFSMEGYVFAGIIFWIICYSMSKYSQKLELKYKTDR